MSSTLSACAYPLEDSTELRKASGVIEVELVAIPSALVVDRNLGAEEWLQRSRFERVSNLHELAAGGSMLSDADEAIGGSQQAHVSAAAVFFYEIGAAMGLSIGLVAQSSALDGRVGVPSASATGFDTLSTQIEGVQLLIRYAPTILFYLATQSVATPKRGAEADALHDELVALAGASIPKLRQVSDPVARQSDGSSRYYVILRHDASPDARRRIYLGLQDIDPTYEVQFRPVLNGFVTPFVDQGMAEQLSADPNVALVEEMARLGRADEPEGSPRPASVIAAQTETEQDEQGCRLDDGFERQPTPGAPPWGVDLLDGELDCRPVIGSGRAGWLAGGMTGRGVDIYIVDSGVDAQHPDLAGRVTMGFSVHHHGQEDMTGTNDCDGHGTAVASIAAGATLGVAPEAHVVALSAQCRVTIGLSEQLNDNLNRALDSIYRERGSDSPAAVLNLSYGEAKTSEDKLLAPLSWEFMVHRLESRNLVVVRAGGNTGLAREATGPLPSLHVGALGLAEPARDAVTRVVGDLASSTRGSFVNLWAPGANVRAAIGRNRTILMQGSMPEDPMRPGTGFFHGSSAAAPHAAGVAALRIQRVREGGEQPKAAEVVAYLLQQGRFSSTYETGASSLQAYTPFGSRLLYAGPGF